MNFSTQGNSAFCKECKSSSMMIKRIEFCQKLFLFPFSITFGEDRMESRLHLEFQWTKGLFVEWLWTLAQLLEIYNVYTITQLFAANNFCNLDEDYLEYNIPETFKYIYWFAEKFSCTRIKFFGCSSP